MMRRYLLIVAFVVAWSVLSDVLAQPESSLGSYPLPVIVGNEIPRRDNGSPMGSVGMTGTCPGFVVASGVVESTDHGWLEGYANVNELSLSMRPEAPWFQRVKELRGQPVEVVLRPIAPREPQEIKR